MPAAESVRQLRELLENKLRMEMQHAAAELTAADRKEHSAAFQRYLDALVRFTELTLYGRYNPGIEGRGSMGAFLPSEPC